MLVLDGSYTLHLGVLGQPEKVGAHSPLLVATIDCSDEVLS